MGEKLDTILAILVITGMICLVALVLVGIPILVYLILLWARDTYGFENVVLFMLALNFAWGTRYVSKNEK